MTDTIKRMRYCPYCANNQTCEISLKNNVHKCLVCNKIFTIRETITFKNEIGIPLSDKFLSDGRPTHQTTLNAIGEVSKCK